MSSPAIEQAGLGVIALPSKQLCFELTVVKFAALRSLNNDFEDFSSRPEEHRLFNSPFTDLHRSLFTCKHHRRLSTPMSGQANKDDQGGQSGDGGQPVNHTPTEIEGIYLTI